MGEVSDEAIKGFSLHVPAIPQVAILAVPKLKQKWLLRRPH